MDQLSEPAKPRVLCWPGREKIGGPLPGAYDGTKLVGFVCGLPAVRNGRVFIHSHMLAVEESLRNTGLGREMKLFQRELALREGYELIEWTFDPPWSMAMAIAEARTALGY